MARSKTKKITKVGLKRFVTKRNFFITVLALISCIFLYNKYLDWRNVENMKQLKAAFEQLERDIERDTGDELRIEADCGSGGKFAEFYSCSLRLLNNRQAIYQYGSYISKDSALNDRSNSCDKPTNGSTYDEFYLCAVRVRVKSAAESIFYEYDVSPGKPR